MTPIDAKFVIVGETPSARLARLYGPPLRRIGRWVWRLISVMVWLLIFATFMARGGGFGKQFWHDVQCQSAADQKTASCQAPR